MSRVPAILRSAAVTQLAHLLRSPCEQVRHLDAARSGGSRAPATTWQAWGLLAGFAVGGSCSYGASLGLLVPRWRAAKSASWLALSAGPAWCAFGPALVWGTGRNALTCVQACLVTMAYGEGVLAAAAGANVVWWIVCPTGGRRAWPARLNLGIVGLANVVMAASLAAQLRAIGVPLGRTLLLWVAVLDGSGALFAWASRGLLKSDAEETE